jgi:hypothetical protein
VALAPFILAGFTTLALAGTAQLCDRHGLIELGDRAPDHSRVVELVHELVAGTAGERLDGLPLASVAVLIRSNVGRRAGP